MAVNKQELLSEVSIWLDNPPWFSARSDSMFDMAQARINRALKGRLAQIEDTLTATPGSNTIALPAGYGELLGLWRSTDGDRKPLTQYEPGSIPFYTTAGAPRGFGIVGLNIVFDRNNDIAHTFPILYREKLSLVEGSDTNWLLTEWPDVYFDALMVEAFAFKRDAEAAQIWNQRLQAALEEVSQYDGESNRLAVLSTDPALSWSRRNSRMTDT